MYEVEGTDMSVKRPADISYELAQAALPALVAEFGPEAKARAIVLGKLAQREVIVCFHCKAENKIPSDDMRMFLCCECRKQIWVTADTNFRRVRLFFVRLGIMRLQEMGICINANQASKLFCVSYDTVSRFYKQLGISVISLLPDRSVEVPTSFSTSVVCRRTRQTQAEKAPFEEEFEMQKNAAASSDSPFQMSAAASNSPFSELELQILEMLKGKTVSLEELITEIRASSASISSALTMLELSGHIKASFGNKFSLANSLCLKGLDCGEKEKVIAESFNQFIKDYFQGIGRKNLQVYSSFNWFAFDRNFWSIDRLRDFFISFPYIPYEEIRDFVTPLSFKIVPRFDSS